MRTLGLADALSAIVLFQKMKHIVPKILAKQLFCGPNLNMIYDYESAADYLNAELRQRVDRNPSYSLRAFAKALRLSPGALSEILKNKRPVGIKAASKVADSLGMTKQEMKHWFQIISSYRSVEFLDAEERKQLKVLSDDVFNLVKDWYHFAILNLFDLSEFEWSSAWISKKLSITKSQAALAMQLLEKLRFVSVNRGHARAVDSHVVSGDDIPSAAVREYHKQILGKAMIAIDEQGVSERDITGVGFAVNPNRIESLKKDIAKFQEQVLQKYSTGIKTEVYFLETALFRITQGGEK